MLVRRIGLASLSDSVNLTDLVRVAAALNIQVARDFQPIWNSVATVSALADADAIEPGLWPVFIVDDIGDSGITGLHLTDTNQPYALVQAGDSWSLTASHECLEMLVDPSGNRLLPSTSIAVVDGEVRDLPGQKFEYLVEIADPSEDPANAYLIDDVLVSDFYTPNFFDPIGAPGVRYSFTGRISRPRQILPGGYISWLNQDLNQMQQLRSFGAPEIVTLPGHPAASNRRSLRGFVDSHTEPPVRLSKIPPAKAAGGYYDQRSQWRLAASTRRATSFTAARRRLPTGGLTSEDVQRLIQAHQDQLRVTGSTRIYAGWHFENSWITYQRAIVVQARRADVEAVRDALPAEMEGVPIDVRVDPRPQRAGHAMAPLAAASPGTVRGELALPTMPGEILVQGDAPVASAPTAAAHQAKPHLPYAPPPGVALAPVTGRMKLRLHASPERGWAELQPFLKKTHNELVIGMYEFTAPHIETALLAGLGRDDKLVLTLDSPPDSKKREQTVEDTDSHLEGGLGNRMKFAWALSGLGKEAPAVAFPTSYHIKVAVRDERTVWLSSGNWNSSNQPNIDPTDDSALRKAARENDRDWHVIAESPELAQLFRAYLMNDYKTADDASRAEEGAARLTAAGAAPAAAEDNVHAVAPAATPRRFFDTKEIHGEMTVRPLLTPDQGGYRAPILELIKSATTRLYMQTQYIHTVDPAKDTGPPGHMELIQALAERIGAGVDVKLITSEYEDAMWIERLQDAGVDAVSHLRIQQRVHNKGIVVDSKIVVVSSQNWSGEGTGTNRDAGLIIYNAEAAQYFEDIFLHDWLNMAAAKARM